MMSLLFLKTISVLANLMLYQTHSFWVFFAF